MFCLNGNFLHVWRLLGNQVHVSFYQRVRRSSFPSPVALRCGFPHLNARSFLSGRQHSRRRVSNISLDAPKSQEGLGRSSLTDLPTNVAYDAFVSKQCTPLRKQSYRKLARAAAQSLSSQPAGDRSAIESLRHVVTSTLETQLHYEATARAFAPSPDAFVRAHVKGLLNDYTRHEDPNNLYRDVRRSHDKTSTSKDAFERHYTVRHGLTPKQIQILENLRQSTTQAALSKRAEERVMLETGSSGSTYLDAASGDTTRRIDSFVDTELVEQLSCDAATQLSQRDLVGESSKEQLKLFGGTPLGSAIAPNLSCPKQHYQTIPDEDSDALCVPTTKQLKVKKKRKDALMFIDAQEPPLTRLWRTMGARFMSYQDTLCVARFLTKDTLTAYRWCRTAACLFDLPYKRVLRLRGPLAAISHVIVSKPSVDTLRDFEISYACVLDSAGQILDDGWVVRLSHEQVFGWTPLIKLYNLSKSAFRAPISVSLGLTAVSPHVLALQGPRSWIIIEDILHFDSRHSTKSFFSTLKPAPYSLKQVDTALAVSETAWHYGSMRRFELVNDDDTSAEVYSIDALRIGTTGEDGFELISYSPEAHRVLAALLLWHRQCSEAGLLALDILRMEAGFCRTGADLTRKETPVQASLLWMLRKQSLDEHKVLGSRQMLHQLQRIRTSRRVGLVCRGFITPGSLVLSVPGLSKLGSIRSVCWSPILQARIAMAVVSNEFATVNANVVVRVELGYSSKQQKKQRKPKRVMIPARIAQLPFVPHRIEAQDNSLEVPLQTTGRLPKVNRAYAVRRRTFHGRTRFYRGPPTALETARLPRPSRSESAAMSCPL